MAEFKLEVRKEGGGIVVYGDNQAGSKVAHIVTLRIQVELPNGSFGPVVPFGGAGAVLPQTIRGMVIKPLGQPIVRAWATADYVELDTKRAESDAIAW